MIDTVDQFQFAMLRRAVEDKIDATMHENNSSREQELDRALTMLNLIIQMCQKLEGFFNEITGDDMQTIMEKLQSGVQDMSGQVVAIKDRLEVDNSKPKDNLPSPVTKR